MLHRFIWIALLNLMYLASGCVGEAELNCKAGAQCHDVGCSDGRCAAPPTDAKSSEDGAGADTALPDVAEPPLVCEQGFHICGTSCAPDDDVASCGDRCEPCPGAPNAQPACVDQRCALQCEAPLLWDDTSNRCVECTEANAQACQGYACDPATQRCTQTLRNSLLVCRQCVSDTECKPDFACVPMEFADSPRQAAYCLPRANPDCSRPFPNKLTRRSLSGRQVDVCTLNEALTTCEAFNHYNIPGCADASECGAIGHSDARCEPIDFEVTAVCTFPCSSTDDCPLGSQLGCMYNTYCGAY